MSTTNAAPNQHAVINCVINAGIDSGFTSDEAHRGSLTPPELDSIHQTNSFKQALELQEEDNRELDAKKKLTQEAKEPAQKVST